MPFKISLFFLITAWNFFIDMQREDRCWLILVLNVEKTLTETEVENFYTSLEM